ncbi:helix-turn-helix domain-containing protein [Bradyrhizobium cytisi]|uniref:Helix-turn-helix domain-containing protein n=1 Tax=Bradyrhizobium cytisi TaxID=515489 RepID=A0A5S4WYF0_9BRAD|nr:helix-turn-helix domain-containing protein [Bradyrhizobium cytisi]TYL85722.1 helix-turn-helix domain-containing protein [Bradyrhizobium cytisi]
MARKKTGPKKPRVTAKEKLKKAKAEQAKLPVESTMYTIPQFCEAHNISLETYYRMARTGTGPEIKKIGHATRISVEAAKAWREGGKATTQKESTASQAASAEA